MFGTNRLNPSILLFLLLINSIIFSDPGKVIFLIGTSSSGKSTLGHEFSKKNENVIFFEHDKIWSKKEINFLSSKLGSNFDLFYSLYGSSLIEMSFRNRNCSHIVKRFEEYPDKNQLNRMLDQIKSTLGPFRAHFYNETTKEIVNSIPKLIQEGKIVILDKIINKEDIEYLHTFNPLYVVVYYPFNLLPQRIYQRNQAAIARKDSYDYRHYLEAFSQFTHLFQAIPNNNSLVIDQLSANEILDTLYASFLLDPHYLDLDDFYKLSESFNFSEYHNNFLNKLGFSANSNYIISNFGNDLIIRTDKLTSNEACQTLERFLLNYSK